MINFHFYELNFFFNEKTLFYSSYENESRLKNIRLIVVSYESVYLIFTWYTQKP